MELIIPCFIAITEQDPDAKTFAEAGCTLLVNEHPDHFGLLIGGESNIIRDRVDACLATSKSIRLKVTIDDEDVTDGLTGTPTISHHINTISSFSLTLAKAKYSPLADNHIDVNKVVVIIAFLEGHEFKIFTGLIDTVSTKRTKKFQLAIKGRGYGKKLRNKRMTLISVQEAAKTNYRGSIIKYLAGKAGITDVNVPRGDRVTIDHSFQDQFIWDMIQKECEIEGWFVRFDEEAGLQVGPRVIKTDEAKYPNPDWDYGENKFVELGLDVTDKGIINKVVILGAIFEEEVITVNEIEVPPYEPVYDEQTTTFNGSWDRGIAVDGWSDEDANFKVTAVYTGWTRNPGLPFNPYQDYKFTIKKLNSDLTITDTTFTVTGNNVFIYNESLTYCKIHRMMIGIGGLSFQESAFSITITIKTKEQTDGGKEQYEEENPTEEFISEIVYTQMKATCQDSASIAKYGERKPGREGTLNYPLAETEEQCKRIGENIILNSHRFIKQPDELINFNPLMIVGQTTKLTDTKIGYNGERWFLEEVIHSFSIDNKTGAIKPRTRIGCVFYA